MQNLNKKWRGKDADFTINGNSGKVKELYAFSMEEINDNAKDEMNISL